MGKPPLEAALAAAIPGAVAAGPFAVVAQLAKELQARRVARSRSERRHVDGAEAASGRLHLPSVGCRPELRLRDVMLLVAPGG